MADFLLVFDLDGTLIDTVPDLANALNETLREHGYAPFPQREVQSMVGDGLAALLARGFAARGADAAKAATALPRFLALYEANAANLSRP
jgi:phosphoglycolate phosphatase